MDASDIEEKTAFTVSEKIPDDQLFIIPGIKFLARLKDRPGD